jgi:hypothetical protein
MQEPFDVTVDNITYAVFPEEDNTFTIFKNGTEYTRIQKDTETNWLKLDYETDLPLFEEDDEIDAIGKQISMYKAEEEEEDEE